MGRGGRATAARVLADSGGPPGSGRRARDLARLLGGRDGAAGARPPGGDVVTARGAIDAYVEQVAAGLPGPARRRVDMMAELRSGLLDAVDSHRQDGLPDDAAV